MTLRDIQRPSADPVDAASQPAVVYEVPKSFRQGDVEFRFLATHRIHEGRGLRLAVQRDGKPWQVLDVNHEAKSRIWAENVLVGYSAATLPLEGAKRLRCAFLDSGLILSQLEFCRK